VTGPLRVVVIGYGPVGARFVEESLDAVRTGRMQLTVVGAEVHEAYNRVLIAEYAVDRTQRDAMTITDSAEAVAAGARVLLGVSALRIDRTARRIGLSDGSSIEYDRIVLATGARANVPTLDGIPRFMAHGRHGAQHPERLDLADEQMPTGVTVLRDLADADRIRAAIAAGAGIVILGAGVLGLELALAAAEAGGRVTVVHHGGFPMPRNLDRAGGVTLARALTDAGVTVVAHSRAEAIVQHTSDTGERRFESLVCADGKQIAGELLVLSCGVAARTELAADAALPVAAGIVVDESLASWADASVFAIGDCAVVAARPPEGRGTELPGSAPAGLIGPGWRQASWLAGTMLAELGLAAAPPELAAERSAVVMLKAERIDVVAVGDVSAEPWDDDPSAGDRPRRQIALWADPEHGRYVKMVTRGGVLEGLVCIGMPRTASELTLLFERRAELPADRSVLLRLDGPDPAQVSGGSALDDESTVCLCNGVTAGQIRESARCGSETVAEVSLATRAGTGCGGCKGRIGEVLEHYRTLEAKALPAG